MEAEIDKKYLEPGEFMDSDSPEVIAWVDEVLGGKRGDQIGDLLTLYYAVRDGFRYNPYKLDFRPGSMKASHLLGRNHGYCIEKANLFGACARIIGLPSRLGFANVRNHIGTDRFTKILKSDVLVFHGYTEIYANGKWVKATPAFNKELCDLLGVELLEFNANDDSVFQQFDKSGGRYMEYLHDYGTFADIPRELLLKEIKKHYAHFFDGANWSAEGIDVKW